MGNWARREGSALHIDDAGVASTPTTLSKMTKKKNKGNEKSMMHEMHTTSPIPIPKKKPKHSQRKTHLGALTSAPASINNFTTNSFPPEHAAWSGKTPSMTELMGWPWERAYLTRPMLPVAAAAWRPKWGTGWGWGGRREDGRVRDV